MSESPSVKVTQLRNSLLEGNDVSVLENELSLLINNLAEINEFYQLPISSILRIFSNANKSKIDIDFQSVKTIITNLSKAQPLESPLLLTVLDMPNTTLLECLSLITSFECSPLCTRIASLIEEDTRKDWYCEMKHSETVYSDDESMEKPADFESNLFKAIMEGKRTSVEYHVTHGANLNAQGKKGASPLHLAVKYGDVGLIEYLISHGSNLEIRDKKGFTPLHLACKYGDMSIIQCLLEKGASPQNKDKRKGFTPLHQAAKYGDIELVQCLINHGAKIDERSNCGMTPLYVAAMNGFFDIVKFLIEAGANIHIPDDFGLTPLHVASEKGCCMVVKYLLSKGANKEIKDKNGKLPMDYSKNDKVRQLFSQ